MRSLELDSLPVVGVLDREQRRDGVEFRRLPGWTRPQLVDPALALVVRMPAGARLEFTSAASAIELDALLTVVQIGDEPPTPPTFDLVVDGDVSASSAGTEYSRIVIDPVTAAIDVVAGAPDTIRFDLPGDPGRVVEIWLPHIAVVEVRGVRITDACALDAVQRFRLRWVHYGSSISHCAEAVHPTETWPAIAARRAGVDLMNLAVAGQCMLDQHVARTIRDLDADFISVKAGINVINGDTMRERTYVAALHGFLDTVRDGHPATPLLVVTPVICPAAEDHPGPTLRGPGGVVRVASRPTELALGALSLRRVREVMAQVVSTRQSGGDEHLHLLEGLQLFGTDDVGDLPDGLHPNAAGYRRMGERFHSLAFTRPGPFAG